MNTQQLLNLSLRDVNKMTDAQLRQATSILRSTGRKRYERLIEQDIYSPAVESMRKSAKGGTSVFPTVKGMDRSQLMNEFRRQKQFIEFKTSTVSGAKRVKAEMRERAKEDLGHEFTDKELTSIWGIVNDLKENLGSSVLAKSGDTNGREFERVVSDVMRENPDLSDKDIKEEAERRIDEIYQQQQQANSIYTSQFM